MVVVVVVVVEVVVVEVVVVVVAAAFNAYCSSLFDKIKVEMPLSSIGGPTEVFLVPASAP